MGTETLERSGAAGADTGGSAFRVLVADPIAREGIARLEAAAGVEVAPGLTEAQLCERIGEFDALVVRSQTHATAALLRAGKRLKVVARAAWGCR